MTPRSPQPQQFPTEVPTATGPASAQAKSRTSPSFPRGGWWQALGTWWQRRRRWRRDRAELDAMSTQHLNDLGIGRGEIGSLTDSGASSDQPRP